MKGKGSSCCNKTGNNATVTNDLEDMKQQMDMIQKIVVNQERVNKANSQYHMLHMMMGARNAKANQTLKSDVIRIQGLYDLQGERVAGMEKEIARLQQGLAQQERMYYSLDRKMQQNHEQVLEQIQECKSRINAQAKQLTEQRRMLHRLMRVRLKLDVAVDAVVVLTSYYATHTYLVDSTLETLVRLLLPRLWLPSFSPSPSPSSSSASVSASSVLSRVFSFLFFFSGRSGSQLHQRPHSLLHSHSHDHDHSHRTTNDYDHQRSKALHRLSEYTHHKRIKYVTACVRMLLFVLTARKLRKMATDRGVHTGNSRYRQWFYERGCDLLQSAIGSRAEERKERGESVKEREKEEKKHSPFITSSPSSVFFASPLLSLSSSSSSSLSKENNGVSDERKEEKEGRHARYTREGQERKERQKEERTKEEDDCDTDDHGDAKEQKEEWKGESHRISDVGSGIDIGMDIQDKSGYEREHDRKALCNYESQSDDAVASDDTHVINITGINRRFQSLRSEIRNQVSAILSMSGGTNE